jgi:hypothetical protein
MANAKLTRILVGAWWKNYHFRVIGGTGWFEDATGDMSAIGEVDFNTGNLIGRYSGQLCTASSGTP